MSIETNWQTARPSVRESVKFLFNNDRLSDVKFVVRNGDGKSESKQVIPAHKLILAMGSPVFEAMFYGELAENRDTIELRDCDYESLVELFRYVYSDGVNLSGSNVTGVLYLAKKYIVPSLADKCTEYLKEKIDPSNVFDILSFAQKYEEKALEERCWKVIESHTEAAVTSEGFEKIDKSLLKQVVVREILAIKEVSLFQAVDRWATKQCEKQGLAADGPMKRRVLGEGMVKAIRFPVMKGEEFAAVVVDTNILTSSEIISLFKCFSLHTTGGFVGFSNTPRRRLRSADVMHCCRFPTYTVQRWMCNEERKHLVCFSVDKNITLHGICLFGSENDSDTITLQVTDPVSNTLLISKSGTYFSKLLHCEHFSYHGFEVMFDSAALLKKKTTYHIEASIFSRSSGFGNSGLRTVNESSVKFTFSSVASNLSNFSSVDGGQFPDIMFSI